MVLLAAVYFQFSSSQRLARFNCLLLAGPFLVSIKHGFVRQDSHIINFFCFTALALPLVSLTSVLSGIAVRRFPILLMAFVLIWQETLGRDLGTSAVYQASGVSALKMLRRILPPGSLGQRLDDSVAGYPADSRLEPELLSVIGTATVASLSNNFTNVYAADLQLMLYPTIQRSAAYTPSLDRRGAEWLHENKPRFLAPSAGSNPTAFQAVSF